ncbi:glycosyltransferase [Zobellia russellii]|uniref:glycosyltransferase n=1 Tax=Zobellia russellii TaxID=248907 RepID=UPI001BFFB2DA|nr:glycosyltransferase [Zobellia russellii]MBT9186739.1 glycosyltransferase [Zobellia russellii]
MQNKKRLGQRHIVFLGESGFPIGLATIQRLTLMARAFIHADSKSTVICRKGVHKNKEEVNFPLKGNHEGISYLYTSDSIYKPKGFLKRNIQKIIGAIGEYRALQSLKSTIGIDAIIISEMKVVHIMRYWMFSKLLDIPIIMNFVEMTSSMQHRASALRKLNDYILDNWVLKIFDGALSISDRLFDYYTEIAPKRPNLKIPIICDFDKFKVDGNETAPYFLYCGSFKYKEVRDFVIEAYKKIAADEETKLYMIVSGGNKQETAALEEEVNKSLKTSPIKLFSNIPYSELVQLYVDAMALLIPLRPTVQDAARFPHKIGEYLASGNPVITTDVGEIKNYFVHEETALIAGEYDLDSFSKEMKFIIDNPLKSKEIGIRGQEMGRREFDYRTLGHSLSKFVDNLS